MYCEVDLYFEVSAFHLQFEWLLTGMCEQDVPPVFRAKKLDWSDYLNQRLDLNSSLIKSSLELFKHFLESNLSPNFSTRSSSGSSRVW